MTEAPETPAPKPDAKLIAGLPAWKWACLALSVLVMGVAVAAPLPHWGAKPASVGSPDSNLATGFAPAGSAPDSTAPEDDTLSPAVFRMGFSFFVGFAIGFATRTFVKFTLFGIGMFFLLLFGLQYAGIIEVKWALLEARYHEAGSWIGGQLSGFRAFITGYLPSAALAAASTPPFQPNRRFRRYRALHEAGPFGPGKGTHMPGLVELWLPILVSAVVIFVVSAVIWMAPLHHKEDVKYCPKQDELADALRNLGIAPGNYMFPNCANSKDYKSEEFKKRHDAGPWGMLNLWPAKPNMGKNMLTTFILYLVISAIVGYVTSLARPAGAGFAEVLRVATTAAFLCYVLGGTPNGVWFGKRLRFFVTDAIDGVVYSFITGAVFAWFWPAANAPSITT